MQFKTGLISTVALCAGMLASGTLAMPVNNTGDVIPDVFFGTGNANGSFTGTTQDNVEVALRGKIRFEGTYNYDGDHTYIFDPLLYPGSSTRSAYNFEWSINTNADGTGSNTIGSFDYILSIDTDPSVLTSFISGDPYALGGDHSFGDNSTMGDGGVEATTPAEYISYLGTYNVSQQSWNMGFGDLNGGSPYLSDPQQQGLYTILLSVLEQGTSNVVASTSIDIQYGDVPPSAVPLPAGLPMLLSAFGGLALLRRFRRTA